MRFSWQKIWPCCSLYYRICLLKRMKVWSHFVGIHLRRDALCHVRRIIIINNSFSSFRIKLINLLLMFSLYICSFRLNLFISFLVRAGPFGVLLHPYSPLLIFVYPWNRVNLAWYFLVPAREFRRQLLFLHLETVIMCDSIFIFFRDHLSYIYSLISQENEQQQYKV